MDTDLSDARSDCSSEVSETRSELESRIYGIIHHNDFSGTTVAPSIDPKYGVEFNANGEVVVYLKDASDVAPLNDSVVNPSKVYRSNGVIPTIFLDDDDRIDGPKDSVSLVDVEFAETSLKKKKKKKKKNLAIESIAEYINTVKTTNALKEYKEKSGINKMQPGSSSADKFRDKFALNVAVHNERALPMSPSEVLKQYQIGKPIESSLWYRCPDTWTPDMVRYYTRIQKSKRNFDCGEELKKIKEKYGSSPVDWMLSPLDLYKSPNSSRVRCNVCKQYGHTSDYCKVQYKPEVCIMCGMEGHNFERCNKKLCLSCGTWQKQFTNNCYICISMRRTKCSVCNTVGHESSYCTESWRQFHSTISTAPEHERNEFAQSTSRSAFETSQLTIRKSEKTTQSTPNVFKTTSHYKSLKSDDSGKSKKVKRLKRLREKKRHSKSEKLCRLSASKNDSINIDVNIEDVIVKRTLTKKNFFKQKKNK